MHGFKKIIREAAFQAGFHTVGFAPPEIPKKDRARLINYVENREYGDMEWMARNLEKRLSPKTLWPKVRSVIVLGLNYGANNVTDEKDFPFHPGHISVYSRNMDYHDVMIKRLKRMGKWLVSNFECDVKVFTDTAPVLEKALASLSGIGWMGKNTQIVSRTFGTWLFLGEIFTTLDIPQDIPEKNRCGNCDRCIRACPTRALSRPYIIDSRECASYLTIEHKHKIPLEKRKLLGNRIYGCDTCLFACPWNRFARTTDVDDFFPRETFVNMNPSQWLYMDDPEFREFFRKNPVKRIGRNRFIRNVLNSIGNSDDRSSMEKIRSLLMDESEIVRDSAGWALSRLGGK